MLYDHDTLLYLCMITELSRIFIFLCKLILLLVIALVQNLLLLYAINVQTLTTHYQVKSD